MLSEPPGFSHGEVQRAAAIKAMEHAAAETGMDFMQERGQNAFSHALGEYVLAQVQDAIHKRGTVFAYGIVLGIYDLGSLKSEAKNINIKGV